MIQHTVTFFSIDKKTLNRQLLTISNFSKSVMVSVAASTLGRLHLVFINPGVKINVAYYRVVLIAYYLLPVIGYMALEGCFILQQDSAPAHRARETIEMLKRDTPYFISPTLWPPNCPDLNPVDYKVWSVMQKQVFQISSNACCRPMCRRLCTDHRIIENAANLDSGR